MTDTLQLDDPRTVPRLEAVEIVFEWMRSMSVAERKRFQAMFVECSDDAQRVVVSLNGVVKDAATTPAERQRALMTIADALHLNPCEEDGRYGQDLAGSEAYAAARSAPLAGEVRRMDAQEESFARRLRDLMEAKHLSQQELAERAGCSQPAVSQMLRRRCRPQRRTVLRLAEALNVHPRELWPDIEVADLLDAVAGFQQDGYMMTPAEARALGDAAPRNRPTVPVKSLPPRP